MALIRDDGSYASQRMTAGYALWWMADEGKRQDVAALLREEEALFVRHLDAGTSVSEFPHILGVIGTDSAKAALT